MSTAQILRSAWESISRDAGLEHAVPATELFDALVARFAEPHRAYHSDQHVAAVLRHLDTLVSTPGTALRLAAFYHDAIYDPTRSDNEERSAVLAEQQLVLFGDEVASQTAALTRATAGHRLDDTPDCAAFLDADLAILGAPPEVYNAYARAIRQEYSHIADTDYRAGRTAILADFLNRPRLYFTDTGHQLWDAQARQNIAAEHGSLMAT